MFTLIMWCNPTELPEHLCSYAEDAGCGLCVMLFDDGIIDTVNALLDWLKGRNIEYAYVNPRVFGQ